MYLADGKNIKHRRSFIIHCRSFIIHRRSFNFTRSLSTFYPAAKDPFPRTFQPFRQDCISAGKSLSPVQGCASQVNNSFDYFICSKSWTRLLRSRASTCRSSSWPSRLKSL